MKENVAKESEIELTKMKETLPDTNATATVGAIGLLLSTTTSVLTGVSNS